MNNKKLNETRTLTVVCINFQVSLKVYYQLQLIFILILLYRMTNSLKNKSKFHEEFINNYNEGSNIGYSLEVDVQYPEKLHEVHVDFQFLSGRMEIGKIKQHLAKVYDKKEYFLHMRTLKQTLNHGLVLQKVQRITKFNLEA